MYIKQIMNVYYVIISTTETILLCTYKQGSAHTGWQWFKVTSTS